VDSLREWQAGSLLLPFGEGGKIFVCAPKTLIMSKTHYLSQEGFDRLTAELDERKTTGRQNVAKAIAEAREKGDLSENAEYDAAKDAQGLLEMKINELETSKVTVMSKVTIRNTKVKKEMTYMLVAESEANLKEKKISVSSPMGAGLLGKEPGDIAEVVTPNGTIQFEVISISL
jgi:transcription elongation factor GreA